MVLQEKHLKEMDGEEHQILFLIRKIILDRDESEFTPGFYFFQLLHFEYETLKENNKILKIVESMRGDFQEHLLERKNNQQVSLKILDEFLRDLEESQYLIKVLKKYKLSSQETVCLIISLFKEFDEHLFPDGRYCSVLSSSRNNFYSVINSICERVSNLKKGEVLKNIDSCDTDSNTDNKKVEDFFDQLYLNILLSIDVIPSASSRFLCQEDEMKGAVRYLDFRKHRHILVKAVNEAVLNNDMKRLWIYNDLIKAFFCRKHGFDYDSDEYLDMGKILTLIFMRMQSVDEDSSID